MKNKIIIIMILAGIIGWSLIIPQAQAAIPAFPGAEGGGTESIGGRGGRIIEVTNLNDSGPGSLRAACEASGARIVVFRVGGIIELANRIEIRNPYITIAGQTAPGGGILIKGDELRIVYTHDVIIRYIRVRTGRQDDFEYQYGDAIALEGDCYNVIIDHCSVSWSNDENLQLWALNGAYGVTWSWNLSAEGLTYNHESCGLIVGSDVNPGGIYDISIHHNMFLHGQNRFPLVNCRDARIINNLIYNWSYYPTGIGKGVVEVDIIGNLYKAGPNTPDDRSDKSLVHEAWIRTDVSPGNPSIYITGNIGPHQSDPNGDNWSMLMECNNFNSPLGHPPNRGEFERVAPMIGSIYPITIHSVLDAENMLLTDVGASKRLDENGNWVSNRDAVDSRLIQEYLDGTGQIPYDENSVGGYPYIAPGTPYTDTDHDAMPDAWETAHGFNPNDPSDGPQDVDGDGYTNVEEFLNGIISGPIGDITGDSLINIQDIQACVNHILGVQDWGSSADVNGNGVDVTDVQCIVNIILNP